MNRQAFLPACLSACLSLPSFLLHFLPFLPLSSLFHACLSLPASFSACLLPELSSFPLSSLPLYFHSLLLWLPPLYLHFPYFLHKVGLFLCASISLSLLHHAFIIFLPQFGVDREQDGQDKTGTWLGIFIFHAMHASNWLWVSALCTLHFTVHPPISFILLTPSAFLLLHLSYSLHF